MRRDEVAYPPKRSCGREQTEVRWRAGMHQSLDCLAEGRACTDEDRRHDSDARSTLSDRGSDRKRDAKRDRSERIPEVVDKVGKQRDAAGCEEYRDLSERRQAKHA
jgi:hypothetical protein